MNLQRVLVLSLALAAATASQAATITFDQNPFTFSGTTGTISLTGTVTLDPGEFVLTPVSDTLLTSANPFGSFVLVTPTQELINLNKPGAVSFTGALLTASIDRNSYTPTAGLYDLNFDLNQAQLVLNTTKGSFSAPYSVLVQGAVNPVPEPGTMALGASALMIGARRLRRLRKSK